MPNPFVSMASFTLPKRITASGWLEHGPFAFWLVEQLRPKLTVELGTWNGYSFACFCQANKELGLGGRVIGIDSWRGDEHVGKMRKAGDAMYEDVLAYTTNNYAGIGELKRMFFSEALAHVEDGTVELLHVDGRHYYEDAKEDHTTWIRKLAPAAVVLFHDTQVRHENFGVYRYWPEVSAGQPALEFEHGHGLGVLQHGKLAAGPLADLLALPADSPKRADVKSIYARLGWGINERWEHERFERRFNERKHPIKKLTKELMKPLSR
jgi:hypothetical protein